MKFETNLSIQLGDIKQYLKKLHDRFVLVPVDKASNNFAIICKKFYIEVLMKELGITENQIIASSQFPHIQADRLAIPFLHYRGGQWVADFLRREFLPKSGIEEFSEKGSSKRIYISRSQAGMRRIVNEEKLIATLSQNFGFQAIILESMPFSEQIATLAGAQVVVAPHGGGLTNLVFCRPGTKVVEIFSPHYINACYWLLGHQVGIEYYYFLGETLEARETYAPEQNRGDKDIWVNIASLLELLQFAGCRV